MDYITVSSSWKHEQISDNGSPLPRYHISGPSKTNEPTPTSCPELVFYRAMFFARSRRCPFVWIDQECTDPVNPTDIQEHLKIMHRVYEESEWTVTSLSVAVKTPSLMESLAAYVFDDRIKYGGSDARDEMKASDEYISMLGTWIRDCVKLLEIIEEDKWFTRTSDVLNISD
jgi:hypothetical protein